MNISVSASVFRLYQKFYVIHITSGGKSVLCSFLSPLLLNYQVARYPVCSLQPRNAGKELARDKIGVTANGTLRGSEAVQAGGGGTTATTDKGGEQVWPASGGACECSLNGCGEAMHFVVHLLARFGGGSLRPA